MNGVEKGYSSKYVENAYCDEDTLRKRTINSGGLHKVPKKRKKTEKFEFGNYNRYYGYRIQNGNGDPRLDVLCQRLELFVDKDVLDIGCNIGHISYLIARDFFAKSVLGIDIDNELVKIARKNIHYYCNSRSVIGENISKNNCIQTELEINSKSRFPDNINFLHVNFVPYSDDLLLREEPKYDVILCLSVTKWIHLNWDDDGLKRSFRKIYLQLRTGGILILEAQPFESYKKKKLGLKLRRNSRKIKFFPHMFDNYLLNEVGFSSSETLPVPHHSSIGFQRPIQLFFKA